MVQHVPGDKPNGRTRQASNHVSRVRLVHKKPWWVRRQDSGKVRKFMQRFPSSIGLQSTGAGRSHIQSDMRPIPFLQVRRQPGYMRCHCHWNPRQGIQNEHVRGNTGEPYCVQPREVVQHVPRQ
ncbi:hypothetical protein ATCV1_z278L [Acanthocystis turfacea chlorella virus 1]|uniref:Uncharacterized protein z278L n=1 Tax=Chlorovirus heliozoae TaxID=322019 RepID=A7K8N8_9PHYC|nr:hypothetical protein ATCV1_z278L [Acanthocystis turfacea chlorella virus 1]ABT16412.1 hypothetical protein ATCV1_z278L [Acanthocystis turfacea chlorella virus 1]